MLRFAIDKAWLQRSGSHTTLDYASWSWKWCWRLDCTYLRSMSTRLPFAWALQSPAVTCTHARFCPPVRYACDILRANFDVDRGNGNSYSRLSFALFVFKWHPDCFEILYKEKEYNSANYLKRKPSSLLWRTFFCETSENVYFPAIFSRRLIKPVVSWKEKLDKEEKTFIKQIEATLSLISHNYVTRKQHSIALIIIEILTRASRH